MLLTPWLSRVVMPGFYAYEHDRRSPWCYAQTGYRSNPFKPPQRFGPGKRNKQIPPEHHSIVRQRRA
ncbi:hypothetical protein [Calycomorphotria hydatis]|uniref:Uncharacterized protein n=1 Tax=Calycomorphotria hydatis TaxID=2528027 RepID=A0A517T3G5_9PLAN|nr:hypothetical protein [Calycomorphotria hydatis]QDT62922.1 hypothetical protein V22_01200 [Calycomorphotria hydatis]